ncbi:MAG: phosphatase PAP2 family protein [Anaerolineae bacterium]
MPDRVPAVSKRLTLLAVRIRPFAWIMCLIASLAALLVSLPATLRIALWHGLLAHHLMVGMLMGFSLLAISLVWSTGQRMDAWAFLYLNLRGRRPLWLDWLMLAITQIGSTMAALVIALIFFMINDRLLAYEFMLGTLSLWLVVELIKALVRRSRPFIRLTQARIVGHRFKGRSFPSGHTSQVFFMATLMAQHFHASAWLVLLLYGIALLVGITRMYVGAHYPRDVLAGIILGSAWGLLGGIVDGYVQGGIG